MAHNVMKLQSNDPDKFLQEFYPATNEYGAYKPHISALHADEKKELVGLILELAKQYPHADFACRRDGVQIGEMFHLRIGGNDLRLIVVVREGGHFKLAPTDWRNNRKRLVEVSELQNKNPADFLRQASKALRAQANGGRYPRLLGFGNGHEPGPIVQPPPSASGNHVEHSLNVILYGPPGTGKTHCVTTLALERLEPGDSSAQSENDWQVSSRRFSDAQRKGRIEFTTFHQNYAYEDFIEGLRAQITDSDKKAGSQGSVSYSIEPGVLKRIADRAMYAWLTGKAPDQVELSSDERKVIDDWFNAEQQPKAPATYPGYVLIVDEINRGNIARIFGELITLVEESKRARNLDDLESGQQPLVVTLPYSKKPFILPPNLYIIGTMNTADRSLIGLDAALRRRFEFIEMRPQPDLLSTNVNGINLQTFLKTLNERIAVADTREHAIGHAYLMGLKEIGDLSKAMRTKILPQLREYFHQRPEELAEVFQTARDGQPKLVNEQGEVVEGNLSNPAAYQAIYGP